MEQCVVVPATVYNNNKLITQAFTQQELSKLNKLPRTRLFHLKGKKNKKMFDKADSLVDRIVYGHRIKLSISQSINSDSLKTGVLLSDFAQQLSCKSADIPSIYFT